MESGGRGDLRLGRRGGHGRPLPIIPEDSLAQEDALQRRLDAGEQFAGLDLPCVRKDGRRIHTSASLALMRDVGGEPESALMIFEDVTERRANVVRLARLTRLYQMLSAVTEVIPEEREPARLLRAGCAASSSSRAASWAPGWAASAATGWSTWSPSAGAEGATGTADRR